MNAANGSTATETTATDKPGLTPAGPPGPAGLYVGRFAPSPTGALHLGSLVAALGSFLDARHHGGRWLLRMEDLDTPRVIRGCADQILRTLELFGLTWDEQVSWQSRQRERYAQAAEALRTHGHTFECSCSRRLRAENEDRGYPGTCRDKPPGPAPTATRFRVDENRTVLVDDKFQGPCPFELRSLGDVVIRRRDGIFAYQLAVVVDDAAQGITRVVRGADLLTSTAWQLCIQQALDYRPPDYAHLPLVVEPDGTKLSKTRRSLPLDATEIAPSLLCALRLLRQNVALGLENEAPSTVLEWAIKHWNPRAFHAIREVRPDPGH
ncbi:MAG: tRNA glutamyl-Q(34) synthetase GluQRS [Gammaproteobacteria bacterium]